METLIKALKRGNWTIRKKAADALGNIGDKRAVEPLIKALEDKYGRPNATEALKKLGHEVK